MHTQQQQYLKQQRQQQASSVAAVGLSSSSSPSSTLDPAGPGAVGLVSPAAVSASAPERADVAAALAFAVNLKERYNKEAATAKAVASSVGSVSMEAELGVTNKTAVAAPEVAAVGAASKANQDEEELDYEPA